MTDLIIAPSIRLRDVFGTDARACTDRIVATFNRATPGMIADGATWYAEGEALIDRLAAQHSLTREAVAAVVAHLSPRTTWTRNVEGAVGLLANDHAPHCMGANVERARAALASDDPIGTLNGPKTRRFALNLLGDREAVTVDVWAVRIALGPTICERVNPETGLGRRGVYAAIEHCYRLAGHRLGIDPVTVQATTWIVARNGRKG
ncbi:hypothetical protein ACIA8K_12730 [Catenuloplanes sp. NPDC051500]|uniref:DUF7178 family protein n=1 Tax=Catenuloplanes sp. NPDC051500 TaxID=3363959 RepID=UPI0037927407